MAGYTANRDGAKLPAGFANDDTVVYDLPSQSLHDRGSKRFYCGQGLMFRAPIVFCVSFSNLPLSYPSAIILWFSHRFNGQAGKPADSRFRWNPAGIKYHVVVQRISPVFFEIIFNVFTTFLIHLPDQFFSL